MTVRHGMSGDALRLLPRIGRFRHTPYPGVLVGMIERMEDEDAKAALGRWNASEPELFEHLNRATPVDVTTQFERDDVTESLCVVLEDRASALCGQRFYVRANLRGLKGRIETQACERALGSFLWEHAQKYGSPAKIGFDDADVVVAVEVIGKRAGVGLLDRRVRAIDIIRPR